MDKLDLLAPETANTEDWIIKCKEEADWALQKIADARKEMQENTDYVQAQIEKLQAWLNKVNQTHESTVMFFESKLAPYVAEQIRGGKKKSISLPNGRVGFRKKSVTTKNNDVLMEYVKKNYGEYIKQVEQLSPPLARGKVLRRYAGADVSCSCCCISKSNAGCCPFFSFLRPQGVKPRKQPLVGTACLLAFNSDCAVVAGNFRHHYRSIRSNIMYGSVGCLCNGYRANTSTVKNEASGRRMGNRTCKVGEAVSSL